MTALKNSSAAQKRANSIAWLRANAEPVVGSLFVDGETTLSLTRSVLADDLDELSVARALRVGDDDAIDRGLFPPDTAETNSYHRCCSLNQVSYCSGLIAMLAFPASTRSHSYLVLVVLVLPRTSYRQFWFYCLPNIPGIGGIPNLPPPPPAIFFIIFCISRN